MKQLSRWLEERFYPAEDSVDMRNERLHCENLKSLTDKHLDVIRYLYMRLNIIDSKASYLLRINALTASVISILISVSAKADGGSIFTRISCFQLVFLVLALLFLAAAFFVTFAIGELEYDRITDAPILFNHVKIESFPQGAISDTDVVYKNTLPDLSARRFLGKYSADDVKGIVQIAKDGPTAANGAAVPHTLKQYEDLFFKITVARVKILRLARFFVFLGVICSMVFIVHFAAYPPTTEKNAVFGEAPGAIVQAATPILTASAINIQPVGRYR